MTKKSDHQEETKTRDTKRDILEKQAYHELNEEMKLSARIEMASLKRHYQRPTYDYWKNLEEWN